MTMPSLVLWISATVLMIPNSFASDVPHSAARRLIQATHFHEVSKLAAVRTFFPHPSRAPSEHERFYKCIAKSSSAPFLDLFVDAVVARMNLQEVQSATVFYESPLGRKVAENWLAAAHSDLGFPQGPIRELSISENDALIAFAKTAAGTKSSHSYLIGAEDFGPRYLDRVRTVGTVCAERLGLSKK